MAGPAKGLPGPFLEIGAVALERERSGRGLDLDLLRLRRPCLVQREAQDAVSYRSLNPLLIDLIGQRENPLVIADVVLGQQDAVTFGPLPLDLAVDAEDVLLDRNVDRIFVDARHVRGDEDRVLRFPDVHARNVDSTRPGALGFGQLRLSLLQIACCVCHALFPFLVLCFFVAPAQDALTTIFFGFSDAARGSLTCKTPLVNFASTPAASISKGSRSDRLK